MSPSSLDRRTFLSRLFSFWAALNLSPLVFAGGGGAAANSPQATVGLVRTDDRSDALNRAVQLGDVPDVKNQRVLIKPNFNTADPAPGSTHNDSLIALIDELQARGAAEVIIGERSGPPNTREVMEQKGIFDLAEARDVTVVNFDELPDDELEHFDRPGLHWPDGFHVPKILNEVDHVIALGCLKTHAHGGIFTMALKLAVGIIPKTGNNYMQQLHRSPHMRKMIAEINLAYRPSLFIIDGVEAFVTGGPSSGQRRDAGLTLVSTDPVAIDAVGVAALKELGSTPAIMDKPVFSQNQIAFAAELGLGVDTAGDIRIEADDDQGEEYAQKLMEILAAEA